MVRHVRPPQAQLPSRRSSRTAGRATSSAWRAQARQLGDVLIVAVNSDASIRRLKGPERPVNNTEDRVVVLAALSCVDHVIVFTENTPAALIEAIRPDLYVNGGDYHPDTVPEAPLVRRFGGDVQTLDYLRTAPPSPSSNGSALAHRYPDRPPSTPPPEQQAPADPGAWPGRLERLFRWIRVQASRATMPDATAWRSHAGSS